MAQIEKGILGPVKGTVGTVTGSKWKNTEYIRIKAGKRTTAPSDKQLAHRAKFSLVGRFIAAMSSLIRITFTAYSSDVTQHNYAFSYTMDKSVTGIYPNLSLDYSHALIAQGSLPNAVNPVAANGGPGEVKFSWTDNSGNGTATANDKAILVAYCEELNRCEYKLPAATRQASLDSLNAGLFSGKPVHTWISFISDEGEVATSIYTGVVNVN
jgi:Family of unknown function (DUF6266)